MSFAGSDEFRKILLNAVDEGLMILGEKPVVQAFFGCLEKREKIKHEEIPFQLSVFHRFVESIFEEGTAVLERRICKDLYRRVGLSSEELENRNLEECVEKARVAFLKNRNYRVEMGNCQRKKQRGLR